jgi:hypothetical protein
MKMRAILSRFNVVLFSALLALVFFPLGSIGPAAVSASEVEEGDKEAKEREKDFDKEDFDKKDLKDLEEKVKLIREDIEKKMEAKMAAMLEDEELLHDIADLQEAEDEVAKNGGDTWFERPFAPRPFLFRQPEFFPQIL